jgi:hypothetical protein
MQFGTLRCCCNWYCNPLLPTVAAAAACRCSQFLPQNLEEFIGQKTPADLTIMLQPWAYHFKRLLLDPAKSVRMKAAAVMAAVAQAVGKALAPQVKALLGPWYLASFDPYPDAAAAARKSLADVFPGRKQLDALMFCRRGGKHTAEQHLSLADGVLNTSKQLLKETTLNVLQLRRLRDFKLLPSVLQQHRYNFLRPLWALPYPRQPR